MDLDPIDILESTQLEGEDEADDLVHDGGAPTPIDLVKAMKERNLKFLSSPGVVDPSPLTLASLRERFPQV